MRKDWFDWLKKEPTQDLCSNRNTFRKPSFRDIQAVMTSNQFTQYQGVPGQSHYIRPNDCRLVWGQGHPFTQETHISYMHIYAAYACCAVATTSWHSLYYLVHTMSYHVIPSHTYILSDSQNFVNPQITVLVLMYHSLLPHTGTHRYSRPSQTETSRESTIRMLSSSAKQALRKLKSAGFWRWQWSCSGRFVGIVKLGSDPWRCSKASFSTCHSTPPQAAKAQEGCLRSAGIQLRTTALKAPYRHSAVAKLWGRSNSFPVVFDHLQATEAMGHKNLAFRNVSSEAARQFSNGTDAGLSLEHAQPMRWGSIECIWMWPRHGRTYKGMLFDL